MPSEEDVVADGDDSASDTDQPGSRRSSTAPDAVSPVQPIVVPATAARLPLPARPSRLGPGSVLRVTPPAKPRLPDELGDLRDKDWEAARLGSDLACVSASDPAPIFAEPDGREFRADRRAAVHQERIETEVGGSGLIAVGRVQAAARVGFADNRPAPSETQPNVLGMGNAADAVASSGGEPGLAVRLSFRAYRGAVRTTTVQTREVEFLALSALDNGEGRYVVLFGPWRDDPERTVTEPVILMRQVRNEATDFLGTDYLDFVFAGLDDLSQWLEDPFVVVYDSDTANKFARSNTTRTQVEADAVDQADAPAVPTVKAIPCKGRRCKKRTEKTVNIVDNGHSQTKLNRVMAGIPGNISVSSVNDAANKLIDSVDLCKCECIKVLNIYGHGASGTMSLGAGESFDSDRELDSSNVAAFGAVLKCLLCPDATVNFFGCNVAEGAAGQKFLQDAADAFCATVTAYTGSVTYQWSYDKDGNVEDVTVKPNGTKVTKTPTP